LFGIPGQRFYVLSANTRTQKQASATILITIKGGGHGAFERTVAAWDKACCSLIKTVAAIRQAEHEQELPVYEDRYPQRRIAF
jgi:hypothetical protein